MRVTYDAEVNAAYIYLAPIGRGEIAETIEADVPDGVRGSIYLDFDAQGRLRGVEVLNATCVLPEDVLRGARSAG